jgi:cytochrome c oxidase subunit 2
VELKTLMVNPYKIFTQNSGKKVKIVTFLFLYVFLIRAIRILSRYITFTPSKQSSLIIRICLFSFPKFGNPLRDLLLFFNDYFIIRLLIFIVGGVIWIFISLFYVKFSNKTFSHDYILETYWIFCPRILLSMVAIPSLNILYELEDMPFRQNYTIKTIGNQWFWTYDTIKKKKFKQVDRYIVQKDEEDSSSNLTRDGEIHITPFQSIRNLVSSKDVIHRWTLPSLGLKTDAIPGRINQLQLEILEPKKIFYGQCSELCGINHRFIPIVLKS